jgi:GlpG protein
LGVVSGLFVAVEVYRVVYPADALNAQWRLGSAATLTLNYPPELERQSPSGFFDLWRGQWWRVPLSAFHHADLLHLALNAPLLFWFGYLLEPRLGHVRFAVFSLLSATISMLPEFLWNNEAVGISGALCAMFGLLIVLRRYDTEVAGYFSDAAVAAGLLCLVGGVFATQLEIIHIANLAHFFGLGYGLLAGEVFYGRWRQPAWRLSLAAAHLALLPAFYFVTHPVWNGNYHWYQALIAEDPADRRAHFDAAMRLDPGLSEPWRELAIRQAREGDLLAAWQTALRGLSYNRSDKVGAQLCREIWGDLQDAADRHAALEQLEEIFGDEAEAWKERLHLAGPLAWNEPLPPAPEDELERFRLDQSIELPSTVDGLPEAPERAEDAPPVDPDDPQSAALGVAT